MTLPDDFNTEVSDKRWAWIPMRLAECCGKPIEDVSRYEINKPQAGCLGICAHCGQFIRLQEDFTLEVLTPVEFAALPRIDRITLKQCAKDRMRPEIQKRARELCERWARDVAEGRRKG